jgi:hypothetical protein
MSKDNNIAELPYKSDLSVMRIAGITGRSINIIQKIIQLKEI